MNKQKLLILAGDSTDNRGDRAILLGNIILLKNTFQNCEIKALSNNPERDSKWYGIEFFNRKGFFEKLKAYSWPDLIFWGGGELIQDDTSRIKIIYWFINIMLITVILRKKVIAFGQGLGPVNFRLTKILTKIMCNQLVAFFSRDNYSEKKLRSYGVKIPIISAFDPAILISEGVKRDKTALKKYLANKKVKLSILLFYLHTKSSLLP